MAKSGDNAFTFSNINVYVIIALCVVAVSISALYSEGPELYYLPHG
jgi:hypothetical protein